MTYRDGIEEMRKKWIGKTVTYKGERYKVVDVDYNGALLIDKKTQYTSTTAIGTWMCE